MKKICIVSPVPTHPTTSGNKARILSLVEFYKQMGFDVSFILIGSPPEERELLNYWGNKVFIVKNSSNLTFQLRRIFFNIRLSKIDRYIKKFILFLSKKKFYFNYSQDAWYPYHLESKIKKIIDEIEPDILQIEYIVLSKLLTSTSNKYIKIIDTHDVMANRNHRYKKEMNFYSVHEKSEAKALDRADRVLAITEEEAVHFKNISKSSISTVGHIINTAPPLIKKVLHTSKPTLGFLGHSNDVNIQTYNYILELLNNVKVDFNFLVCGEIIKKINTTKHDNYEFHQNLPLNVFYDKIQIMLNPTINSTGLKIKNVEALYHGKILITSFDGAQGIKDGVDKAFLCIENTTLNDILHNNLADYAINGQSYIINKIEEWKVNLLNAIENDHKN